MKKTGKIGLLFLLGGVLLNPFKLCGSEPNQTYCQNFYEPVIFSKAEGKLWVEKCIEQHPEILWLADTQVRKTEESRASFEDPYSVQLFGQKFIEFDRTIMTLHCLKLILDGSDQAYQEFVSGQPKEERLSKESFKDLHLQGQYLLRSKWGGMSESQIAQAMETALVLGDIGKSEKARAVFKPYGIEAPDQDDFYGEAMHELVKNPKLCASFARLPLAAQRLLSEVANLAHYGHITHLEGGPNMFSKLKESQLPSTDPVAIAFDLFVHTCDVAGALGHVNNHSSLAYTENTYKGKQAMGGAVNVLMDQTKTEWDAYNAYLSVRAFWLGLSIDNRLDRVVVRVGAMLRLFSPEEGKILKQAILQIDEKTLKSIAAQLDVREKDQLNRTPTYMPALLVNLANNLQLGDTQEERLSKAVILGLPFIARVLETHKQQLANQQADPNIPLNFNKMAGIVKISPFSLNQKFTIDKEGNISI